MSAIPQELIETFARRRDEASFRALYQSVTPMMFALAVRLSGSRTDAEELTQETWARAVERFESFDRRSKFSTWLCGILVNCHREAARRTSAHSRAQKHAHETVVIEAFPSPQAHADPVDVERALSQLAPGYREVVILHDVHGYTHAEIATMLSVQEGTSKSQLMRGRVQLRQLLTQSRGDDRNEGDGRES